VLHDARSAPTCITRRPVYLEKLTLSVLLIHSEGFEPTLERERVLSYTRLVRRAIELATLDALRTPRATLKPDLDARIDASEHQS